MERLTGAREQLTWEKIAPSLTFGLASGLTGAAFGSIYGLYRSHNPKLFTFGSGIYCTLLGSTFHYSRSQILLHRPLSTHTSRSQPPSHPPSHFDLLTSSTLGGAISGSLISTLIPARKASTRGPLARIAGKAVPGAAQMALLGWAGQRAWVWVDGRHTQHVEREVEEKRQVEAGEKEKVGWRQNVKLDWLGLKKLSDEEYAGMLTEKVLKLEVEVALIDEEIEKIRLEEQEREKEETELGKI
ncbi:uncharacterized protein KY384_004734 [Bacidia gigantensis]|uniref:uncharacterized protein n=1 Tax=Bacidia gigantensis TaxID=2732470 RepID=UPI001D049CDE|nr:uncharacterized protein KY384_004734 [Bacidia gigantensis]KAG8530234.1 hypothetical protein KY384_004734 [Bacidia gigantensis]